MAAWMPACSQCGEAMVREGRPLEGGGDFWRCPSCKTALHLSKPGYQGHRVKMWTVRRRFSDQLEAIGV